MYRLHIGNKNYSSWSLRPWILMRETQLAFEERLTWFDPATSNAAFRQFSPTGKVPCLIDGETTVWDSLAIAEYLAERQPGIWPREPLARAWARCAAAEMHSGFNALRNHCPMNCGLRVRLSQIVPGLQADLTRLDALWNEGLRRFQGPFLAGADFTAVDAFYAPVAFRIQTYELKLSPASLAYATRLRELPGMKRWYAEALAETVRDPEHDAEAAQAGELLADLRVPAAARG
jgi:glutathione S-transferase